MFIVTTMKNMWYNLSARALGLLIFSFFAKEITTTPIVVERLDYFANCPRIVKRAEWKARNATNKYIQLPYTPVPYVVVHHGGIPDYCFNEPECAATVRSYQNLHMDFNHWIDIGYNFVIGEDGNVYEGRGWDSVGAHAPGYNTQGLGVCTIGDFSHFLPNKAALHALDSLIACGVQIGKISPDYNVIGHRQARDTECPGDVFYKRVQNMSRWTSTPHPVYPNNDTTTTTTARAPLKENALEADKLSGNAVFHL